MSPGVQGAAAGRRHTVWALLAALLAGALILVAAETAGWPFLRAPLVAMAARAAGVPVEIDPPFRMRLLRRPGLEAGHLRIGAAAGPPVPWLLDGRDVTLDWRWADLWRWRRGEPLRIAGLQAGTLDLQLARDAGGRASWQLDARSGDAAGHPEIDRLQLRAGRIAFTDAVSDSALVLRVEGGEGGAAADGYRVIVEGRVHGVPLQLQGRTGALLPLLDTAAGESLAVQLEGRVGQARLVFDGHSSAWLAARGVQGTLRLSAPSLAALGQGFGLVLPHTAAAELATRIEHDAGLWTLRAADLRIGASRLQGDLDLDLRRKPSRLSGAVRGPRLALGELLPAIGGAPAAAATAASGPRRVLPQRRLDIPSLRAMDADVQVALDTLDFGSQSVAPMQAVRTRLTLEGGVLVLNGFTARAAGGQVAGTSRLDGNARPARWAAALRFTGVDVDGWLRGLRRPGSQPWLTGTMDADLDVTGAGRSTSEILAGLDGRVRVLVRDGTISHLLTEAAGLDLAQALGVMVRGDQPLPLRCARLDLAIARGIVTPRQAVVDNRDSTLRIGGQASLADESLALVLRARPKDFSPLTLRSPVTVTGSFAQPQFGIEGGPVAGRLLGAVVLGALVGPLAALLPLIDPGEAREGDPCAAAAR